MDNEPSKGNTTDSARAANTTAEEAARQGTPRRITKYLALIPIVLAIPLQAYIIFFAIPMYRRLSDHIHKASCEEARALIHVVQGIMLVGALAAIACSIIIYRISRQPGRKKQPPQGA